MTTAKRHHIKLTPFDRDLMKVDHYTMTCWIALEDHQKDLVRQHYKAECQLHWAIKEISDALDPADFN